jgi:hypothetical protein
MLHDVVIRPVPCDVLLGRRIHFAKAHECVHLVDIPSDRLLHQHQFADVPIDFDSKKIPLASTNDAVQNPVQQIPPVRVAMERHSRCKFQESLGNVERTGRACFGSPLKERLAEENRRGICIERKKPAGLCAPLA